MEREALRERLLAAGDARLREVRVGRAETRTRVVRLERGAVREIAGRAIERVPDLVVERAPRRAA